MNPSQTHVEMLSAYLDGELPEDETTRVEQMLERDPNLRRQLAGLRSVSAGLGHLERLAPPPTLGQDVARRIALAGEKRSLLDRIEGGLSGFQGQSNVFVMFAVVLALATIMYFFSQGLERSKLTPVVFDDPAVAPVDLEGVTTVFLAERLFRRQGDRWIEEGLGANAVENARRVELERSADLLESHPELRSIAQLGHAVLRLDGEVIEIVAAETAE